MPLSTRRDRPTSARSGSGRGREEAGEVLGQRPGPAGGGIDRDRGDDRVGRHDAIDPLDPLGQGEAAAAASPVE
jgi:hypothetical protein